MDGKNFLIDSNSFIRPKNEFYSFDFAPSYWNKLEPFISDGTIIILDRIKNEIENQKDILSDWLKKVTYNKLPTNSNDILKAYREVLNYVKTCGYYKESAVMEWAKINVADPWLIAAAKTKGYTIITFEVPNLNLNEKIQSKRAKIPDVARHFGVKCENLFYLVRQLEIKL